MEIENQTKIDFEKRWKTLLIMIKSVNYPKQDDKWQQMPELLDGMLKHVFEFHFSNSVFINNIKCKANPNSNGQDLKLFSELVGYSFIEIVFRSFLKLTQNVDCNVELIYFKETIIQIFQHFRLNDGKLYNYLIGELFDLLIDLNHLQNDYLKNHDSKCFVDDIRQLKRFTDEGQEKNLNDYLLFVPVPLMDLRIIRIYYIQLLKIITEFVEPIKDLSCFLSDKVCTLIDLNSICSTKEMDNALIDFISKCFFVFNPTTHHFQKYFQFVCSIIDRYSTSSCEIISNDQQKQFIIIDNLCDSFLDLLNYMHEEDKTIQLMFYLVENSMNLHKCKSPHFLKFSLPKILFKIFDGQFDGQRHKTIYYRLVSRILDFYSTNLSELYLQSDEWCELIKLLLILDYFNSSKSDNNLINNSHLFKFWEFLNQNADKFLFDSANSLIKSINYSNVLLPCFHYLSIKEDVLPNFLNIEFVNQLVNIFLCEFKKHLPSIEHLSDDLIEHIYFVINNFAKLANQLEYELTDEQIAVFYLPWHERKLIFVKEQQKLLNILSRRNFKKSNKILKICLSSIAEQPSLEKKSHSHSQIDFFDFVLENEFNSTKNLIKSVFIMYMYKANQFSPDKFKKWLDIILRNKDHEFICSILGSLSCLLFKDCGTFYRLEESNIQIENVLNCNLCENPSQVPLFETDQELINLVRSQFNSYLNANNLNLLSILINKSSSQLFNHIDIDEQLMQNVLNLFDVVDPEANKNLSKLLENMFNSLKNEKERFFICFSDRFFQSPIINLSPEDTIAKFENIGLLCDYFPKYKLQIITYMIENGILHNREFVFNTKIILDGVVFKYKERVMDYYNENRIKICEKLLSIILEQDVEAKIAFDWIKRLMYLIADHESNFTSVFNLSFEVILPYLIKNRTKRSEELIRFMLFVSKDLNYSKIDDLVLQFFEPIILYFVRTMNIEEIKSAFEFIKKLTNIDISELFSKKCTIVYILLYEYCSQEISINYLLSILNSEEFEDEEQIKKKQYVDFNKDPNALSLYLTDKMGGYLLNLNAQFLRSKDIAFKTTLLKSLNLIIKSVPTQTISNYFEKLMAILRSAFRHQSNENEDYHNYVHYIYTVWDTLISNCEIKELANNLSLICKNLMDLLPIDQTGVSSVFQKLIVNNEKHLTSSLRELHFIPTGCRLMNQTESVIQKYLFKMPENDRDFKRFSDALKILEESLKIENPEIKFFHYRKLLQILSENEKCLRSFCSSGNDLTVQPIISRLIYKLITDSKMDNSQLRSVIGECLGEFGAIDPGRLDENRMNDKSRDIPFFYNLKESDFAALIINKLVAYFDLISDSKLQDCINYALQEILKHYKVKSSSKNDIWSKIQPRCQSICQQLFKSKFQVDEEIIPSSHPVYKEVQSFSDWIIKLCISLVGIVKDKFAKSIFDSLCPLINYCTSLAEYILPFIIFVILVNVEKQEDTIFVFEEINYLIRSCLPKHDQSQTDLHNDSNDDNFLDNTLKSQEIYEAKSEQYQCVHALFSLLDFLNNWRKMIRNSLNLRSKGIKQKNEENAADQQKLWQSYNAVNDFLIKINKAELSVLAASCQSYDRALMYLEEYIFDKKEELANNYDNLQKLYVALEEPDGVEGIIVCRKEEPSLYNSILSHEVNGQLQEAISCCEKANKLYPNELSYSKIYLKCLLLLGHENTAKIFATNSIEQQPDYQNDLQPFIVEAAWKMGEWDNLESFFELNNQKLLESKFEVGIGNLFILIRKDDHKLFDDLIKQYRLNEVNQISVSSVGNRAYARNYPKLVRLHMLNEIEYFCKKCTNSRSSKESISILTKRFTMRTKNVQTSVRSKEPIINLQRVLLNICSSLLNCRYESELAELWLASAKLARKSNNFQSAYNFLLEIQLLEQQTTSSFSKNLKAKIIIEKAKYYWQKETLEDREKAVKELSRCIEQLNIQMEEKNFNQLKPCLTFAKLHLLYNNYSEKTLNLDANQLRDNYTSITTCYNNYEESYYNLGIYFDSLAKTIEEPSEKAEYLDKIVKNLGESLKYGSKHVYESMPKLLTSWCDLGDFKVALSKPKSNKSKKQQEEIEMNIIDKYCQTATKSIKFFLSTIPPHNFYTAISQLTSRMCHPLTIISDQISDIIRLLVKTYPHQTLWLILSSLLSENKVRKEKFEAMIRKHDVNYLLVKSYSNFGHALCKVCLYELDKGGNSFKLSEKFDDFKKLIAYAKTNDVPVLVPFQCFMNVQMPNLNQNEDQQNLQLKDNLVYIHEFGETVMLLKSLVKPKKITIKGSDGNVYVMMCKPKDDLRKDNRTMEFNNLVNRHLRKNNETRKRNLFIKTYTVVPLRHDCGLIEWINHLEGYRQTVMGTYKNEIENFQISNDKIMSMYPKKSQSLRESLQIFKEKILPLFPTIYHKFFLNQFQNPTAWYNARMNYIRSCAVMSIVGYIIGLGDRHGENISINLKTGNLVHVDFNCIFNKGAELEVPEVVPFRLTHNMIDAMGPTGYEGVFRKTCESTLRVMREEREALMSVLTTFVHDPLIEWNKGSKSSRSSRTENETCEAINKTALENLDRIKYRLNGLLGLDVKKDDENAKMNRSTINRSMILNQTMNSNKIPISVNYQVSHLINEATSLERLCRMYVGWNSFL